MTILNETGVALLVNDIIIAVSFAHNLALLLYHAYSMLQCCTHIKLTRIQNLSLVTVIFLSLFTTLQFIIAFDFHPLSCRWAITIGMILFLFEKNFLYFLFLERLFSVFQDSAYRFSKKSKQFSRMSLIIYCIVMVVLCLIFGDGYYNTITNSCKSNYPFWMAAFAAFIDIICCSIISILFARRLLILHLATPATPSTLQNSSETQVASTNNNSAMYKTRTFHGILSKSTLLTLIALLTTPLSLILASIVGITGTWVSLDAMVNIWCVILMFSAYDTLYKIICHHMDKCISIRCLSCYSCTCCCKLNLTSLDKTNLKIVVGSSSNLKIEQTQTSSNTVTNDTVEEK
eukprot:125941_1